MVGQLKRYSEQDQDNRRLSRDMGNMKSEKRSLDSAVYSLQSRRDQLQAEIDAIKNGDAIAKCEEQIQKLQQGLTARGHAVPRLE